MSAKVNVSQLKKVGEIATQVRGVTYSKNEAEGAPKDGYVAILRAMNITEHGLKYDDLVHVPKSNVSDRQMLQIGDIVVAASSGSLDIVGKASIVESPVSASFGAFCKVVRPGPEVYPAYLGHFFRTSEYRSIISKLAQGANINNLKNEHIDDLDIRLPSLDEQRRIAAVLDKADALRRQRQESLQLTEKLLQSVFIDMFGDPVTNPRGYRAKTLKEWGRVSTGTTPKSSKEGMFGGAIPFVTPGDLKETWVQTVRTVTAEGAENSRTVRKGATLVCCIGATIGKMGKAAQSSAFNQQVNAIEWYDEVLDDYGLEAMRFLKRTIIQNGSAATLPILNKSAFQSLELPVAPIEEQKRFIEVVRLLERVKADSVESADEAEKMFSSLQQRAFRGELDLSRLKLDADEPATVPPVPQVR